MPKRRSHADPVGDGLDPERLEDALAGMAGIVRRAVRCPEPTTAEEIADHASALEFWALWQRVEDRPVAKHGRQVITRGDLRHHYATEAVILALELVEDLPVTDDNAIDEIRIALAGYGVRAPAAALIALATQIDAVQKTWGEWRRRLRGPVNAACELVAAVSPTKRTTLFAIRALIRKGDLEPDPRSEARLVRLRVRRDDAVLSRPALRSTQRLEIALDSV